MEKFNLDRFPVNILIKIKDKGLNSDHFIIFYRRFRPDICNTIIDIIFSFNTGYINAFRGQQLMRIRKIFAVGSPINDLPIAFPWTTVEITL